MFHVVLTAYHNHKLNIFFLQCIFKILFKNKFVKSKVPKSFGIFVVKLLLCTKLFRKRKKLNEYAKCLGNYEHFALQAFMLSMFINNAKYQSPYPP